MSFISCLLCPGENWVSERKENVEKFLHPVTEDNKNVLMALGAMAFTNGDFSVACKKVSFWSANHKMELPQEGEGIGVF